jgi:hypothetical protein
MVRKPLPEDAVLALCQRLELFPTKRAERKQLVQETADLYGVSAATVYRALRTRAHARPLRRTEPTALLAASKPRSMVQRLPAPRTPLFQRAARRGTDHVGRQLGRVTAAAPCWVHGIGQG